MIAATGRFALVVVAAYVAGAGQPAQAQLPAFPGAEGVAANITGGRGGDVYKVTNLADSGAGSLRYGIQTAPTTGRTIVFDVAGTINLQSSLDFNGKDNIAIAGQTAPAGGITLAGSRLRINPLFDDDDIVDPISNVIVQFLRVRPGENATNADGVWVQSANNVIIDHVTTSWSVDEGISSTHDSNNVTVQWSTMTQGLFGHSYGSLLNGGAYTYAHNLYAHNKSRNPRLQQSQDLVMQLDFVNNVIYNPQDRFAYGGDEYYVNWVGNYGIRGPGTGDTNHAFARDTDAESHFYVDGNLMDNNTNGLLDGVVPALEGDDHDAAMFREGASYTLLNNRVNIPATNVSSAQQAYVQVLSRAGVANFRDAHDRDMIRDVINQQPGFLESESEWGPYPTLPTAAAAPDGNATTMAFLTRGPWRTTATRPRRSTRRTPTPGTPTWRSTSTRSRRSPMPRPARSSTSSPQVWAAAATPRSMKTGARPPRAAATARAEPSLRIGPARAARPTRQSC